jgi:hypothetical protein
MLARETEKQTAKAAESVSKFGWDGSSLPENLGGLNDSAREARLAMKLGSPEQRATVSSIETLASKFGGAASKFNTSTGEILGKIPGLNTGVGIGSKLGGAGALNIVDLASRYAGALSTGGGLHDAVETVGQGFLESSEGVLMEHPDYKGGLKNVGHDAWSSMKDKGGLLLHGMTLSGLSDMLPGFLGGNRDVAANVIESQGGVDRLEQALYLQKRKKLVEKAAAEIKSESTANDNAKPGGDYDTVEGRSTAMVGRLDSYIDAYKNKDSKSGGRAWKELMEPGAARDSLFGIMAADRGGKMGVDEDEYDENGYKTKDNPTGRRKTGKKIHRDFNESEISEFLSRNEDGTQRGMTATGLRSYYERQGLQHTDNDKKEAKKVDDIPAKIDGYMAENIKVLEAVVARFDYGRKELIKIWKSIGTLNSGK